MLKFVLLGALSYRALTGYQLKQFVDRSAKHFWYAQTSQIYRTLESLQKEGLLISEREERGDAENGHERRIYSLTEQGRSDLLAWLKAPMTEIAPTKDALLVRLFFSAQIDKTDVLTQLRLQRALHAEQLALLRNQIVEDIRQSAQQNPHIARDAILWDATRRMGELTEEAYVRWLDETIQRIENEL